MDPRPETDPQPRATSAVVVTAESKHRSRSPQPTVLRRVGGVTLLDRTVKVLGEAGVTRIVVVAGYRSEDVAATIHAHGLPVELVGNPDWQQGTSTSVLAGLHQIDEDRCLVIMGDHVFEADDLRRLMAAPGRNVLAVDRDPQRQVGGLGGVPPLRVRTAADGRLLELAADLKEYAAVDAGLSLVHVADVVAATADAPAMPWAAVRRRMLDYGFEMTTCDFTGLWAAIDTPDGVRALERAMWHRYGSKPTDQIIARTVNRRISGPLTRQLLRTRPRPHVATLLAFAPALVASGLIAVGDRWAMAAGGLGVLLGSALDGRRRRARAS